MIDWLTHTLLATSLLMAIVLLIREPVRQRFGPAVAYGLWLIPALRLLLPTLTTTVERTVPAASPVTEAMPIYAPSLAAAPPPAEPVGLLDVVGLEPLLLSLWLAGAAAMIVRGAIVYHRQRSVVLGDGVQLATLDRIRIVRSGAVRGPMAFGIFDRVIAVPIDFDERYDARQRRLALDHELAHHRSGDLVANHLAFVLLCLQWFNPLAWVSHAAFRFDQEAACDARVLDKACSHDRAAYGHAIAKAASGRALLFAGALDRPSTLQRRLRSMLSNPGSPRRTAGKALIVLATAAALPLTATWATLYIDVPAPAPPTAPVAPNAPTAPTAPPAPLAPMAPAAMVAPVAPVAPTPPVPPAPPAPRKGDRVMIHGYEKNWEDLTPAERAEIRRSLAEARRELQKVDMEEIRREVREAMAESRIDREEMRKELAEARIEVDQAMREIDANADEIRRAGHDPESIKATVRASLEAVKDIDVDAITRQALSRVDEKAIAASIKSAEAGLRETERKLDEIERKRRR